jgi:hypothetical protein
MIKSFCSAGLVFFCSVASGSAVVLDWASVTWPPGALSESYDIDPNNPGNDITISMTGNTGAFNSGSPSIGTGLGGTGRSSLQLSTAGLLSSQSIVVTINFLYTNGVYVQNLNILNVDYNPGVVGLVAGWQDQIRNITAMTATGQTVNPVAVAGNSAVTITGNSTTGFTATGNATASGNSPAGNVSLDFGNYKVTQIQFTFGAGPNAPILLANQLIGLDDITYSLTPEVHPALLSSILCGFVLVCTLRRRFSRNS